MKLSEAIAIYHGSNGSSRVMQGSEEVWLWEDPTAFISTWRTTADNETLILPTTNVTYNCIVDWGDGSEPESFSGTNPTISHQYAMAGDYEVIITGTFPGIRTYMHASKAKLITVKSLGDVGWTTLSYGFMDCANLSSFVTGSAANTANVTNMYSMFRGCPVLSVCDLSGVNTANVTDMRYMFFGCSSLESLDLSSFNTAKVTDMTYMFGSCGSLEDIDLSSFNTALVTLMTNMFNGCSSLTSLDLSSFDTAKVTIMSSMFYNCSSLTSLDISNFDTAKVTMIGSFLWVCSSLKIDLSFLSFVAVTYISSFMVSTNINEAGTTTNYDALLNSIVSQGVKNSLNFHGGFAKYSLAGETARWQLIAVHTSSNADGQGFDKSVADWASVGYQYWHLSELKIYIKKSSAFADWTGPLNLGKSWSITDGGLQT
jgi:surface protein